MLAKHFLFLYNRKVTYRGIVLMVAHRSPKPPVRVRVLLPLPLSSSLKNLNIHFNHVKRHTAMYVFLLLWRNMKNNFFNLYFIVIIILILLANIITFYTTSSNLSCNLETPNFHFSENSNLSWPLPRIS